MPGIKDIRSDIKRLRAVYSGLPRTPEAIFIYLDDVFRTVPRWRAENHSSICAKIFKVTNKRLDRRISKNPTRLIVELTCTADVKLKSRYANALRYASLNGCPTGALREFIRSHGGLEDCSRKYSAHRKEKSAKKLAELKLHSQRRTHW